MGTFGNVFLEGVADHVKVATGMKLSREQLLRSFVNLKSAFLSRQHIYHKVRYGQGLWKFDNIHQHAYEYQDLEMRNSNSQYLVNLQLQMLLRHECHQIASKFRLRFVFYNCWN